MKTERKGVETAARAEVERNLAGGLSRRSFLSAGAALAGAAAALRPSAALADEPVETGSALGDSLGELDDLASASIVELQSLMIEGRLTSLQLVQLYQRRIQRIDRELGLNSVLQLNPDAERIAIALDQERARSGARGSLHGIPILLKDNIDTGDRMMTTAGSLGLVGQPALQDSTAAAKLRQAGAVILGKLNLSEWGNFRGFDSSSGWSGVGGQTGNPFLLDRNPGGSGSGAAVSAALCAAALATETDGSIACPASACGVTGIKPTVGLTSRAGVVPISATQDTVGVHGRCVADAAAVLGALTGVDARDAQTRASAGRSFTDYLQFVDPRGLRGARIGVLRQLSGPATDPSFENALQVMRDAGAEIVENVELPSFAEFQADASELVVLVYEFKRDLNAYLATRQGVPIRSLASAIAFNRANADVELAWFGQQFMELAEANTFNERQYRDALERGRRLAADEGIDAALRAHGLDALVAPASSPAWPTDLITGDAFQFASSSYAAVAGYPMVTVPMGYAQELPLGISFIGTAYSEPLLIKLAAGFEAAANVLRRPRFLRTLADVTRARMRENSLGHATLSAVAAADPTPLPSDPSGPPDQGKKQPPHTPITGAPRVGGSDLPPPPTGKKQPPTSPVVIDPFGVGTNVPPEPDPGKKQPPNTPILSVAPTVGTNVPPEPDPGKKQPPNTPILSIAPDPGLNAVSLLLTTPSGSLRIRKPRLL